MSFSTLENKLDKLSILVGADSEKEENTFIERQRLTIRWWNKAIHPFLHFIRSSISTFLGPSGGLYAPTPIPHRALSWTR